MRRARDFSTTIRSGRRLASGRLVLHLLTASGAQQSGTTAAADADLVGPLVGLVVGRGVGNAVVRHRTARRLRHLLTDRLGLLPLGSRLVVRALPSARDAASAELAVDLDRALGRAVIPGSGSSRHPHRLVRPVDPRTLAVMSPA